MSLSLQQRHRFKSLFTGGCRTSGPICPNELFINHLNILESALQKNEAEFLKKKKSVALQKLGFRRNEHKLSLWAFEKEPQFMILNKSNGTFL